MKITKENNIKGISMITLVITIITVIILAGAIILTLNKNNPIESANEAVFKSDLTTYKETYQVYVANIGLEMQGDFKLEKLNADKDTVVDGKNVFSEIFGDTIKKHEDDIKIINGKLTYTGISTKKMEWAKEIDYNINGYTGEVIETANLVNVNEGTIEAIVVEDETVKNERGEQYIFSTYTDEANEFQRYENTIALRRNRDGKYEAIVSKDVNNQTTVESTSSNLSNGTHVIGVSWKSGDSLKLYIDGKEEASVELPATSIPETKSEKMYIGKGPKLNIVKNGYFTNSNIDYFSGTLYMADGTDLTPGGSIKISTNFFCSQKIKVDVSRKYKFNLNIKSLTQQADIIYPSISTYTSENEIIGPAYTYYYTKSSLVKDLKPGDTIAYLDDTSKWRIYLYNNIFMSYVGVYDSDKYKYKFTNKIFAIKEVNQEGKYVVFEKPYSGPYIKSGEIVTNNFATAAYLYPMQYFIPQTENKTYSSYLKGEETNGVVSGNIFRGATDYVYLGMLNSNNIDLQVDDIEFIDLDQQKCKAVITDLVVSNIQRSKSELTKRYNNILNKGLERDENVVYSIK